MNVMHGTRALAFGGVAIFWACGALVSGAAVGGEAAAVSVAVSHPSSAFSAPEKDVGNAEDPENESDEDKDERVEDDEVIELPRTPEQKLWDEFESLLHELHDLRIALADAELRAKEFEREAKELRQFIEDREEYGKAYEEFQAMRQLRERELRERRMRDAREQYKAERDERRRRLLAARSEREERRAQRRERRGFEDAGFSHLGLNIYLGQMAYTYRKRDTLRTRVRYSPIIGRYLRPEYREEIDFTEMIISGSIVNASEQVRNIGVAVTFFDERGNQVGNEIVQVNNARPGVPYPFTSTIQMALDRPFTSTSSYVLFADSATKQGVQWPD